MLTVLTQSTVLSLCFTTMIILALGLVLQLRDREKMSRNCRLGSVFLFGGLLTAWVFLCLALPIYYHVNETIGAELAMWHLRFVPVSSLGVILLASQLYASRRRGKIIRWAAGVYLTLAFLLGIFFGGAGIMPNLIGLVYPASGPYDILFYFLPNIVVYLMLTYWTVQAYRKHRKKIDLLGIWVSLTIWGYVLGGLAVSLTNSGQLLVLDLLFIIVNSVLLVVFFAVKCRQPNKQLANHPWQFFLGSIQFKMQLLFGAMLLVFLFALSVCASLMFVLVDDVQRDSYAQTINLAEAKYLNEMMARVGQSADELALVVTSVGQTSSALAGIGEESKYIVHPDGLPACSGCPGWSVQAVPLNAGTSLRRVQSGVWSFIGMARAVAPDGTNYWTIVTKPYRGLVSGDAVSAGPKKYEGLIAASGELISSHGNNPDRKYLDQMLAAGLADGNSKISGLYEYELVPLYDHNGIMQAYIYRYLPQTERDRWTMLISIVITEIGVLLGVIMLLLAWYALKQVVAPLVELKEAADSVRSGKYDIKMSQKRNDEFGGALQAFKEMARSVASTTSDLKHRNQEQQDFLNFVAHELKTPISAVRWALEVAQESGGDGDEVRSDMLDSAVKTNERMRSLVQELLEFSRLERGAIEVQTESVDAIASIKAVLAELSEMARHKNIVIDWQAPKRKLPRITSDAQRLHQVLVNVVGNAIKYTPDGGTVQIRVRRSKASGPAKRSGDYLQISVQDSGIGIPVKMQPKIFEKFYRADNAVKSEIEGTGLGLHVSKRLVEMLGGEIWFTSAAKKGTTFMVTQPVDRVA